MPIHDFGEVDGHLYVTMRLIKGRDRQTVLGDGPLPPPRAVGIVEQIASALNAAHEVGLIHRDVKPSNILITEDDFAYLIDFGIARTAGETGLTTAGATLGTWAYMAPERFRTGSADARADVYSLACVLYQSLTGRRPFAGESLEQVAAAHMFSPPPTPSKLQREVPSAMDQVIATGMAKEPDQRYATTKDLVKAARAALKSTATTPPRAARPAPAERPPQGRTAPPKPASAPSKPKRSNDAPRSASSFKRTARAAPSPSEQPARGLREFLQAWRSVPAWQKKPPKRSKPEWQKGLAPKAPKSNRWFRTRRPGKDGTDA